MADETEAAEKPVLSVPSMKKLTDLKVTIPLGLVGVIGMMGWKADDMTVSYLSEWFVTKVEAQSLSDKFEALDDTVEKLSAKIDVQRVRQIEQEIFDRRVQSCMADGVLRNLLQNQIAALVSEWRALTNSSFDPPTLVRCEDLG